MSKSDLMVRLSRECVRTSFRIGLNRTISGSQEKTKRRHHPDPQMSIPITLTQYQQLLGASNSTGFEKEDWDIAAEAIDVWLRRRHPDAIPMPATKGLSMEERLPAEWNAVAHHIRGQ
ncbi:MAG: hypothetical protein H7176_01240 [Bdellovibrionales bacterium]|nr:hypothetical protein [Massilia sp.]